MSALNRSNRKAKEEETWLKNVISLGVKQELVTHVLTQ